MSLPGPCPVSISELLRAVDHSGRFHHLSIVRTGDGRYQASFKERGNDGYYVVIEDDMLDALTGALGPGYGHSWSEVLEGVKEGCTDHPDALDDNTDLI